jgi:hypothetical protein
MTKLMASLFALAALAMTLPASADCGGQHMTVQAAPVVTSDANGTAPMTPVPPPATTTAPKTGG